MKFKSALITEASGSIGGMTASHNRGGQYLRARAVPVNPSSLFQQNVRGIMTACCTRWSNILTAIQRAAWEAYADAVTIKDKLGAARKLTGCNWYVACNVPRMQAGGTILDTAPTIYVMGSLTAPGIVSATAATEVLSISFTNTDDWATAVGGKLLVYCSQPMQQSVNFFNGPYRYSGAIAGAVVPPTSPLPITSAHPFAVGNRIHVQFRAITADGRISPSFRLSGTGI